MKVGDYVRTGNGEITKIKAICEQKWEEPECIYSRVLCEDNEIYEYPKHIKSSPNIIDLIEPNDLLYIDIDGGYAGGIVVPRIPETLEELNKMKENISSGDWILEGIITHEQLESMEYRIGE